ncbi:hypothetical protein ACHAWF_015825, partial [Thalassiosira exigua]
SSLACRRPAACDLRPAQARHCGATKKNKPSDISTMRSIFSLGTAAALAATPAVSAETTVAFLEFGPGGSVHRATSSNTESNVAAVSSLWNVLHRPTMRSSMSYHAGMPVVPDLFNSADAGIVVGIRGDSVKSMPTAISLLEDGASDVVGHVDIPGQVSLELVKLVSKGAESVPQEEIGGRLQSTAENAARGALGEGIEALSLAAENDETAAAIDEQLRQMLQTLKKQAAANGKTVVLHLVVEGEGRRRLEENQEGGENQDNNNANAYSNEKTMYEIQTFNLYLWTSVGLFVIVSMVISFFIAMPLMPDTLLFGETAKMGTD